MPNLFLRPKLWCIISFTLTGFYLNAQQSSQLFSSGSRDFALAYATVSLPANTWAAFSNPAGLANIPSAGLGITCENRYSLKELTSPGLTLFSPTNKGALGFSVSYSGTNRYNAQKYTMCYAHKFGPLLEAGISLNYFVNVLPDEYERGRGIAASAGMIFHPVEKLNIGAHAFNFTASEFNISGTGEIPVYLSAGASWTEKTFLLCTQVTTGKDQKTEFSAGTEVAIVENFYARAGITNSDRFSFAAGIGFIAPAFSVDLSCSFHQVLGLSSSFGVEFFLGKHSN